MRLFTGIAIPTAVTDRMERTLALLRPTAALRWAPLTNLHITTKFIGAWEESRLEELRRALSQVTLPFSLEITVSRFGYHPNPHQPKVFFAGVRGPGIELLNTAIEGALEPLGCPREQRPYSPHLTLARIRGENVGGLRAQIATLRDFDFGVFNATAFHLYASEKGREGSVYRALASFEFGRKEAIAC